MLGENTVTQTIREDLMMSRMSKEGKVPKEESGYQTWNATVK